MKNYSILMFWLVVLLCAVLSASVKGDELSKTQVVVISALHGAHKNHPNYNYETLYSLVGSYAPDFVGVEIRPEDIKSNTRYLTSNYPQEMVELSLRYKDKTFGFDWFGESIEGKQIPKDYWKNLKRKELSRLMNNDQAFLDKKPEELIKLNEIQYQMVKSATAITINDGSYGRMCRDVDKLQEQWFKNTPYMALLPLDKQRDRKIGDNINKYIEQHKGSRIILVMGADHRTFAIENIKMHFNDDVEILPVTNLSNRL